MKKNFAVFATICAGLFLAAGCNNSQPSPTSIEKEITIGKIDTPEYFLL